LPEKKKAVLPANAEETAHFPTTHSKALTLVTFQVPPVIAAQDKQSMTPRHVCVESKMRFPTDNHNIKNQQKTHLTSIKLIILEIKNGRKTAHFISTREQVFIPTDM